MRTEQLSRSISGLVVEYVVAIDVTRVRFPADACFLQLGLVDDLRFAKKQSAKT